MPRALDCISRISRRYSRTARAPKGLASGLPPFSSNAARRRPMRASREPQAWRRGHGHGEGGLGWPKKGHMGVWTFVLPNWSRYRRNSSTCAPLHRDSDSGGLRVASVTRIGSATGRRLRPPPDGSCTEGVGLRLAAVLLERSTEAADESVEGAPGLAEGARAWGGRVGVAKEGAHGSVDLCLTELVQVFQSRRFCDSYRLSDGEAAEAAGEVTAAAGDELGLVRKPSERGLPGLGTMAMVPRVSPLCFFLQTGCDRAI
ncbi:hypothetical protein C4D60_Mb01t14390 [Musa balbisiana]|uniref:Uncharacterized protein n=1 Tax=Musa balbisiana TaxID=52838 RepID=A0A4V4H7C5_MUSBA|nr:hypothetical protein C4D60_Mb01t14390 [Musa balbisiana]